MWQLASASEHAQQTSDVVFPDRFWVGLVLHWRGEDDRPLCFTNLVTPEGKHLVMHWDEVWLEDAYRDEMVESDLVRVLMWPTAAEGIRRC